MMMMRMMLWWLLGKKKISTSRTTTTTTITTLWGWCLLVVLILVLVDHHGTAVLVEGMSLSSSSTNVSKFASQPFIQRALKEALTSAQPRPQAVLSFFFGVDYEDQEDVDRGLRKGGCLEPMSQLWFAGGPDYDDLCRTHFADLVRWAGTGTTATVGGAGGKTKTKHPSLLDDDTNNWTTTVDGTAARMILCDQISRNAFRGTSEAYAYDETALLLARKLVVMEEEEEASEEGLLMKGEYYLAYYAPTVYPLMHSESIRDHEMALDLIQQRATEKSQSSSSQKIQNFFHVQMSHELEHKKVIDRFGRYPHRNIAMGRDNTPDEIQWLSDIDNLPIWAQ